MKLLILKLTFVFVFCFNIIANAQSDNEAISSIEENLVRLEEVLKNLTSKVEELNYQQKQVKKETANHIKDINLSINELREKERKREEKVKQYEEELQTLQNMTSVLKDDSSLIKKDISKLSDTVSSIATKEPVSLVDAKESKNKSDKENSIVEELLIENNTSKATEKSEVDKKENDVYNNANKSFLDKNYTESAIKYAEFIKAYPESKNFHNALLNLGISMKNLNKTNNACQAFANIINSKENIDENIKASANKEFDKLNCKNLNSSNGK